jgi:hypothetical protein
MPGAFVEIFVGYTDDGATARQGFKDRDTALGNHHRAASPVELRKLGVRARLPHGHQRAGLEPIGEHRRVDENAIGEHNEAASRRSPWRCVIDRVIDKRHEEIERAGAGWRMLARATEEIIILSVAQLCAGPEKARPIEQIANDEPCPPGISNRDLGIDNNRLTSRALLLVHELPAEISQRDRRLLRSGSVQDISVVPETVEMRAQQVHGACAAGEGVVTRRRDPNREASAGQRTAGWLVDPEANELAGKSRGPAPHQADHRFAPAGRAEARPRSDNSRNG